IALSADRMRPSRAISISFASMEVRLRKRVVGILLMMGLAGVPVFGQEKKPPEPLKMKVGDVAPDFTLLEYDGQKVNPVSLHDFKGKKQVALAFFVFAFTGG